MRQQVRAEVQVEVDNVELDDVQRTLEQVLLDALIELQQDGRYEDLKFAGPVTVMRRAA